MFEEITIFVLNDYYALSTYINIMCRRSHMCRIHTACAWFQTYYFTIVAITSAGSVSVSSDGIRVLNVKSATALEDITIEDGDGCGNFSGYLYIIKLLRLTGVFIKIKLTNLKVGRGKPKYQLKFFHLGLYWFIVTSKFLWQRMI